MRKSIFSGLWQRLNPFRGHQGGNVAVIFGLSAMTLVVAAGGGTDVVRQMDVRSRLQDAADAAVLRAVMSSKMTDEQREIAADQAFINNFGFDNAQRYDAEGTVGTEVDGNTTHVTYDVEATVENLFLQMIGMETTTVTVVAKAQSQMRKSEIVLVLDSTGSMSKDGRMTNLKSSVKSVLDSLMEDGENVSGTKVAVVPFDTQVKIDKGSGYSYINYGQGSVGQSCTGISGRTCDVVKDAFNKVCGNVADSSYSSCKSGMTLWYRTYTDSSSPQRTYYVAIAKSKVGSTRYEYKREDYSTTSQKWVDGKESTSENGSSTGTSGWQNVTTWVTQQFINPSTATSYATSGYTSFATSNIKYSFSYGAGAYGARTNIPRAKSQFTDSSTAKLKGYSIIDWPDIPDGSSNWPGCVIDREKDGDWDVSAESPGSDVKSLYPAWTCANGTKLLAVRALGEDIANIKTYVDKLQPSGATNVTIGVQWGAEMLSPSAPYTGGVPFGDETTQKYMILVTDGENTENRWWSVYTGSKYSADGTALINARTEKACKAARDKGITVFVVRVMEGDSSLLKKCASKDEYYYDLSSASELNTALSSVFEAIKKTRLTQ
ncbi:TadE/TadG family type IV pilus assembly protein [Asticcacaulis endophyticus]|uniref:VWFA domain-containing protein n=1 Tax=Asticcacaulis endophyticus TaxID=1395890 RepID=A0A918QFV8_9CAUL|nr:pilus assembly protein [Asticcacaulis endophyticus]GGZ43039.1 hypothetical protein GCM10011273_32240 [Asticcacaulis endophyticus]